LMGAPGVGALVAITYRSAIDDPGRFGKSRTMVDFPRWRGQPG
jgi:transposase